MKRLLYILAFTISSSILLNACAEENLQPSNSNTSSGGGGVTDQPFEQ